MEDWAYEQDTGHINALAEPPKLLSVQLLRFERSRMGEISKLEHIIHLPAKLLSCRLPISGTPISHTPDSGHYKTFGAAAPSAEPCETFTHELHAKLAQGAEHPALRAQNHETSAARAKLADVQEVMRTWRIAFYTRSQ